MVIARLESALGAVEDSWSSKVRELDVVAQELLEQPAWEMSRIVIDVVLGGQGDTDESVIASCVALEFLEQALRLGQLTGGDPDCYIENNLLITDYLYAQAIEEVISINEPTIIGLLARAIMATAEDRVALDFADHRRRLTEAALKVGSYLQSSLSPAAGG